MGTAESRLERGPAVTAIPGYAVASERVQKSISVDAPKAVGVPVGDDQVPVGAAHDTDGPSDVGFFRRYAGSVRRPRDTGDMAGRKLCKQGIQVHGTLDFLRFGAGRRWPPNETGHRRRVSMEPVGDRSTQLFSRNQGLLEWVRKVAWLQPDR